MKKLTSIALILLVLGGLAACRANPTPTPLVIPATPTVTNTPLPPTVTPTPTAEPLPPLNSLNGPPLRLINMVTAKDGWGLISDALLVTHNGGVNWFSVPLPEGQVDSLSQASFVDMNTVSIIVPAPDGRTGQLYHTSNGGGSWDMLPVPFLHGDFIIKYNIAYFMETTQSTTDTETVVIYASSDNGTTWDKVSPTDGLATNPSIPEAGLKTGLSFINVDRGWLGIAGQSQKILVYHTEDTGHNWVAQQIPEPQNIASLTTNTYPPVFFANDEKDGILPVDFISTNGDQNRVFYTSTDGGLTWTPGEAVIDGGAYAFLDPKTGWAWGKGGIYFTDNGGKTWLLRPVAFGRSEKATCLSFVDANTGWMLTTDTKNRVRIYNTIDGGSTWMAVNP